MIDTVQAVKLMVPNARVDCCPYEAGEDGTGYFIRIGMNGHWLSKVRKTPHAAWLNAKIRINPRLTVLDGQSSQAD
jgi:hypothetical protein